MIKRRTAAPHLRWLLACAVAIVALTAGPADGRAAAAADGRAAEPAAAGAHRPGRLVSAGPLPEHLRLPGAATAHRITYTSTGFDGEPAVVAGAVFVPDGPPPHRGWPVISWAHGTVGVADVCAQSVAGRSARDVDYLSAWLRAGYAVVATEYEGLGTPGPHPYLHGRSEAYGVIDIVRAARSADPSLGRTWLAVGQSQGAQAVLFAGAIARSRAPELNYRGAIATAPPSQWRTTVAAVRPFDPTTPAIPNILLVLESLRATHPDLIEPADHLTPAGRELFARVQEELCFRPLAETIAGRTSAELFAVDAAEQELLTRLLEQDADIPIVAHRQPVFIAQGTADTVVYPPASRTTADQLSAAGTDVTFRWYPGADHSGVLSAARDDLLAWAGARVGKG
ncbi:lipase family protein [Jiangella anatolica]|uniref:Lipase n=1 Tax=Jiangella anatolica TaxID=2670374 RepID=A0A2W2AZB8_9ACTN|nr:lipase family protein [Jiangella anatolica]PZF80545.1 lipase [Jiangella anatolica]